jgi:hypothetical protein
MRTVRFFRSTAHDDRLPATPGHRWHHDDPEALVAAPVFVFGFVLVGLWGLFRWALRDEAASGWWGPS